MTELAFDGTPLTGDDATIEMLQERLDELEGLLRDPSWTSLEVQSSREFSKDGIDRIARLSRIFALKNPLIQQAIRIKLNYVWGRTLSIRAADPKIDSILQTFLKDSINQAELFSQSAREQRERELQTDGNLFFLLVTSQSSGQVRLQGIPLEEITEIVKDPDRPTIPWFYKRLFTKRVFDYVTGTVKVQGPLTEWYPDWRYRPTSRPRTIGKHPIRWDAPLYHIRVNSFTGWDWGIPEVYAVLDWARAYKNFLEDWSSLVRAHARYAWQITTKPGPNSLKRAQGQVTGFGQPTGINPEVSNLAAATFLSHEGTTLSPVRSAGAAPDAGSGKPLKHMIAAGLGLPEPFFGDVSGTYATADKLERPVELSMKSRQTLWASFLQDLFQYVLLWASQAPEGKLRSFSKVRLGPSVFREDVSDLFQGGPTVELLEAAEVGGNLEYRPLNTHVDIEFPPLIEADTSAAIGAVIQAATLGNSMMGLGGTFDLRMTTKLLLRALGEDDVDLLMKEIFPEDQFPMDKPIWIRPDKKIQEAQIELATQAIREGAVGPDGQPLPEKVPDENEPEKASEEQPQPPGQAQPPAEQDGA
jgi:hypothetical protein